MPVANGAPVVTGVAVSSTPASGDTYGLGETVRVTLTFSEPVDVTGTPGLTIDLDPAHWGGKTAAYEAGSGTAELTFAHTVVEPNESTQGVAVLADTLALDGGAIRSSATQADADLAHTGLDHDPNHKVDWQQTPPAPSATGVALASAPADGDTYGLGETVRVTLTFSEAVDVTGTPALTVRMDPDYGDKPALYESGSGTAELTFAHTVVEPNLSTKGVAVTANSLTLDGGAIRSAESQADADLSHAGLDHDAAHKVDWQQVADTTAPTAVGAEVDGAKLTVTFDEALAAAGTGSLPFAFLVDGILSNGSVSPERVAVAGATVTLHLGIGAQSGQTVSVSYHAGSAGNALRDDAGNVVAGFDGFAVANRTPRPSATATAVRVSSTPVTGDTYGFGETVRVTVTFSEAVDVTGTPRLTIDMDPAHWGAKRAAYEGGSGTTELVFAHTVVEPNVSTRGIALLADTLEANGGAIRSAGTSLDADLAHAGLSHDPAHKVDWRPLLSVADAEAHEGEDDAITFTVTLSRPATAAVTVDYATADGTATAGEDYTATSGTLTLAAGEQTGTIDVPLLDDAIDEGEETFTLRLSNARGARIDDGEATGTIINSDHMPRAWTARFGRTVAVHVVDAVEARLDGASESYLQLAGRRLGGPAPDEQTLAQRLAPQPSLWEEAGSRDPAAGVPGRTMTFRDLLLGSAFHLVSNAEDETMGPRLSAWGRVAASGFDGREDELSLNGTVTTATLGVDGTWRRWLTGLLLAYSEGDGSFTHANAPGGDVSSSLTSLHPYVAYTLSDRVRLWGLIGYGSGAFRLDISPSPIEDGRGVGSSSLRTDLTMTMGALGIRGALLQPSQPGGLELALRSDVLWMVMDSARADNLAATEAEASRLRLVLEGSRPVALADGGSFTPSLEVGLRHDGGDADTGTGVVVGGSLRYASAWGLSIEASLRALVAHEARDYTEWGASGALRFAPGQQGRGLTASITPSWGAAAGGMSRLWDQQGTAGLVPAHALAAGPAGRLDAELGYGLATFRGRGLLTPYARVALTEGPDQAWHLGTRLTLAQSLNFSLEATRRHRDGDGYAAPHELALRANLGF